MLNKISGDMTVEEVLDTYPKTVKVFMDLRIPCLVCGEPLWGTLEETAEKYGVELSLLLERLNQETT
jgi:hybrid cluster-associated redox disulfide protein